MKCLQCGAGMKTARENFRHQALGLSRVTLVGVEVSRCSECGDYEVAIPRLEELHRVLARTVATKSARLVAEEIRFLRKHLGWSGVDFAEHFDVTPQTVSRWENGKQEMSVVAERLLRLCALAREPIEDYSVLKRVAKMEPKAEVIRLCLQDEWVAAAAA